MQLSHRFNLLDIGFILVVVAVTVAFLRVLQPFVLAVFLGAVLARMFWRPYRAIRARVPGPNAFPALLTVVLALIVVAVPLVGISIAVYAEAVGGYAYLSANWPEFYSAVRNVEVFAWLEELPIVGEAFADLNLEVIQLGELLRNLVSASGDLLIDLAQRSFVNIGQVALNTVITLILMFFLLMDGERLLARVRNVLPVSEAEFDRITSEGVRTIGATLVSTFVIGFVEAAFGVVMFFVFGLPSPFLWGVVILILSIIPLVGGSAVLVPAGIVLALTGNVLQGLLFIALSVAWLTFTQNVLRPYFLGERSGLHPAVVLLATIGGISWLGIIGFLLGPLIAALFVVVWTQFGLRFAEAMGRGRGSQQGASDTARPERARPPTSASRPFSAEAPDAARSSPRSPLAANRSPHTGGRFRGEPVAGSRSRRR